jgi:DNA-binding protein HU-beta
LHHPAGARYCAVPRLEARVNKSELIDALADHAGLPKPEAGRAIDALFGPRGVIARALRGGQKVQITGFGTFQVRARAARTGRDPRTGAPVAIPAASIPAFKPGQQLREAMGEPG